MIEIELPEYSTEDPIKSPVLKVVIVIFILTFIGSFFYVNLTSDDAGMIRKTLITLTPDQVEAIKIKSANKDWKINLTLNTITIQQKEVISKITNELNKIDKPRLGQVFGGEWTAYLIIEMTDKRNIQLKVYDTKNGFLVDMINVMGQQSFYCQGLKKVLEDIAEYKGPIGG